MANIVSPLQIACVALLGLTPLAYGQQTQNSNMSGMSGSHMQGMGGMQGGTNMQAMMKRCDQMLRQMTQGKPMGSRMQKTMQQCDQVNDQKGGRHERSA